ncbi:MAG: hypothetical protein ABSA42_10010 [Terracidiphilus sp.]|jgi:hypothetical protein
MEIGKPLTRCGAPGASPINCLLDGRSMIRAALGAGVCAESSAAKRQNEAANSNTENFAHIKGGPSDRFHNVPMNRQ